MSDDQLKSAYRRNVVTGPDHLSEIEWEALACGDMEGSARDRALAHIMSCAECAVVHRSVLELENNARQFDPGAAAVRREPAVRPSFRSWRPLTGLATAAALVAAVAGYTLWPDPRPKLPATTSTPRAAEAGDAIKVIQPRDGSIGAVQSFQWVASARAERYVVQVFTTDGTRLWESGAISDTRVTPTAATLGPGKYLWSVTAFAGGRPVAESPLVAFEIER